MDSRVRTFLSFQRFRPTFNSSNVGPFLLLLPFITRDSSHLSGIGIGAVNFKLTLVWYLITATRDLFLLLGFCICKTGIRLQLKIRESGQIHDVVRAKQARRTSSQLVPNQISNPLFPRTQKSTFTLLKTSDERVPGQVKRAKNRTERAKPVPQSHKIEQIEISSTLKSEMVAVAQLGRRRSQFIFDFFLKSTGINPRCYRPDFGALSQYLIIGLSSTPFWKVERDSIAIGWWRFPLTKSEGKKIMILLVLLGKEGSMLSSCLPLRIEH